MTIVHAIILGIVEGLTEFLPVSSTGHLILTSYLLGIPATDTTKSFEIAIQLGAIAAVVVLYGKKLVVDRAVLKNVCVAFVPTAIVGLVLHKVIKAFLLGSTSVVLIALGLGGIVMIFVDRKSEDTEAKGMTTKQAFLIGCAQSLAVIPGISRAAATIVGGLLIGTTRREIVEFSFLLAIPTIAAATALDLLKTPSALVSEHLLLLGVGSCAAFITAMMSIRWFLRCIAGNPLTSFGWYRIAVAIVGWLLIT